MQNITVENLKKQHAEKRQKKTETGERLQRAGDLLEDLLWDSTADQMAVLMEVKAIVTRCMIEAERAA